MAGLRIPKRRRRECKTDYKMRLNLLKSGLARITIRRTNRFFSIQLIESHEAQDKVVSVVTSKDLIAEGFDKKFVGSLKSLPAGYLTGLLFASKIDKKKKYIVDIGMKKNIYGNRNTAVIKGLIDGGVKINANKEIFPSKERLNGEHLSDDVKKEFAKLRTKLGKSKDE